MRDPKRIPEVIAALTVYWYEHPDLRLGQILGNFEVTYYTEDEILLYRLRDPDYFPRDV